MKLNTTWLTIDPLTPKQFEKLSDNIARDQFTQATTTGFIVDAARAAWLDARFIQKRSFVETIVDPFGNELKAARISYAQTRFILSKQRPNLVVINPPRSLSAFVTRIGEHADTTAAIFSPTTASKAIIAAMARKARIAKITGILASDIELRGQASAKVLIQGEEDIRAAIKELIGERKHCIKEVQLEALLENGADLKVTVKENARFSIQTADEECALTYIRAVLQELERAKP